MLSNKKENKILTFKLFSPEERDKDKNDSFSGTRINGFKTGSDSFDFSLHPDTSLRKVPPYTRSIKTYVGVYL